MKTKLNRFSITVFAAILATTFALGIAFYSVGTVQWNSHLSFSMMNNDYSGIVLARGTHFAETFCDGNVVEYPDGQEVSVAFGWVGPDGLGTVSDMNGGKISQFPTFTAFNRGEEPEDLFVQFKVNGLEIPPYLLHGWVKAQLWSEDYPVGEASFQSLYFDGSSKTASFSVGKLNPGEAAEIILFPYFLMGELTEELHLENGGVDLWFSITCQVSSTATDTKHDEEPGIGGPIIDEAEATEASSTDNGAETVGIDTLTVTPLPFEETPVKEPIVNDTPVDVSEPDRPTTVGGN